MLINLVWDYPHNELLVTLGTAVYGHDFLCVQFFGTKVLHPTHSVGGVSLLENWILEEDDHEQGNFPVNTFIFVSILSGLIFFFFGAKL